MDIVADAGAVARGIIVAKDGHMVALAVRDLQDDGDEVCFGVMGLADLARHMCAAGVEVAQRDKMNPVRNESPVEHPLHRQFRIAIAVRRPRRVGFENRHSLRLAVGGRRGREDDVLDAVLDHALEHRPRAAEVIIIILEGIYHALADLRIRREVDDRVDLFAGKDVVAEFLVPNIALVEARLRMDGLAEACLQIVRHDNVVAVVDQLIHGVAADVARAAEY